MRVQYESKHGPDRPFISGKGAGQPSREPLEEFKQWKAQTEFYRHLYWVFCGTECEASSAREALEQVKEQHVTLS
ncbi:hypothetical protein [Neorhodopirellula lusitana]|uniref:hypothetical protein n=1 Tax=Neorhodopirellula lusitana TaxID=445327 RepID=UPI00384AA976